MKTGELHLHSLDQFDSQNDPEKVCKKLSEMGAKGFALTQHGVLSAVEQMKDAADKYNLKFIPGVETYYSNGMVDNCHLLLLSKDDEGYKAISKAVTRTNNKNGKSVMNFDTLKEYFSEGRPGHGHSCIERCGCSATNFLFFFHYFFFCHFQAFFIHTKRGKNCRPSPRLQFRHSYSSR